MDRHHTLKEIEQRNEQLKDEISRLHEGHTGSRFTGDEKAKWNELNGEYEANEQLILEKRAARRRVEALARDARHIEREEIPAPSSTAAATTIAIGDLYTLKEALPPRYRPRASVLAGTVTLDKARRLVGPASPTEAPIWAEDPPTLLRMPVLEQRTMPQTFSSGGSVLTIGDFSQFLICDRIGMQVELIPHLFGSGNRFPTGQRGLYAWWRSTSKVLAWQGFRTLKLT